MTCIVGVADGGHVYIAGDSAGVSGWDLTVRADQKVWASGAWAFGFTSSFRMGQLLRYRFTPPPRDEGESLDGYLVGPFVDALRTCLKDGGFAKVESGREEGGVFLVGHEGRLFVVEGDFQVGEPLDGFAAVGCGDGIARGALFATADLPPEDRLQIALDAAERYSAGVRGPFSFAKV